MHTSTSLAVWTIAVLLLNPFDLPTSAIDPPPFLPAPGWVNMVDQGGKDARLSGYLTPQGITLLIVAENPLISRAGDLCFTPDGSLFLLEWRPQSLASIKETVETLTYRDGSKRSFTRATTTVKDVIKRVGDPSASGAFDQAKTVLESEPVSCMMVQGEWLYTAGSGMVHRYRRSRKDGPYDVQAVVVRGFGGSGPRPAFGLSMDFDGSLLIAAGPGSHDVEGSDGSRAAVEGTGAIFRCRADGSRLELVAVGLGDPRGGAVFDRYFQAFQLDVSAGAELSSRRLLHLTEASDFGFRASPGGLPARDDSFRKKCLHGLPGVMTPINSRPRPATGGLCCYADSGFPPFIQGLLLCPDPARRAVQALKPERRDSTFAITEQFDLVRSDDLQFFPAHVLVGPDGAIYVSEGVEVPAGRIAPSSRTRPGRLYRLSWTGGPAHPALALRNHTSWSRMASLGGTDLVKQLGAVDGSDRLVAQQELIRRGTINKATLIQALGNREIAVEARLLAAGVLCLWWDDQIKSALLKLATDDEAPLRRTAAECLGRNSGRGDSKVQEVLLHILGDPDPASRRTVALAMARLAAPDAADCLTTALSFDIGGDPCLRDGLVRALESLGKPGLERLLALANSGEDDRLELAVEAFSAMRSPLALEVVPQLLGHPHLRPEQRVRLLRSLARYGNVRPADFSRIARYFATRLPREPEMWLALAEVSAIQFGKSPGGFVRLVFSLTP